jgi:hypothetical protein
MSTTAPVRRRLGILLTTTAAAASFAVLPAAPASAQRPVGDGSSDACLAVIQAVVRNPSLIKPRGDQMWPDHRSWAAGCE